MGQNWRTLPKHMKPKTPRGTERGTQSKERRSGSRTPLQVALKVRHQNEELDGVTRDLSTSGIFLYTESGVKAGSRIELVMMLPPDIGLGPGGWTLCEASVVRVEEAKGRGMGIAATINRIDRLPEIV